MTGGALNHHANSRVRVLHDRSCTCQHANSKCHDAAWQGVHLSACQLKAQEGSRLWHDSECADVLGAQPLQHELPGQHQCGAGSLAQLNRQVGARGWRQTLLALLKL